MPVTHLGLVNDFEECLKKGGIYKFEITSDEMPHLDGEAPILSPLGVQDFLTQELMKQDSTWARVVKRLAVFDTVWIYRRTGHATYEVTCIIPPPIIDGT
jgi:hypothetical protein